MMLSACVCERESEFLKLFDVVCVLSWPFCYCKASSRWALCKWKIKIQ